MREKYLRSCNTINTFVLFLLIFVIQGCASNQHRVRNNSEIKLYDVTVTTNGQSFNHGVLTPKLSAGYSGSISIENRYPVKISWHSNDGGKVSKTILLPDSPSSQEVVFNIENDGVRITYEE